MSKTRKVEYARLWDNGTWDTKFIAIPADTPEDKLEEAIREAAGKLDWRGNTPVIVALYHAGNDEDLFFDEDHLDEVEADIKEMLDKREGE